MPRKPKRPCSYPNCPNLTDGRFCEEHARLENRNYERFKRNRKSKKKYNAQWKRIRAAYAREHPFCEECLQYGRYILTEEIHHVLPLREGGTHDVSNLKALCKSCHSRTHAKGRARWEK